MKNKLRLAVNFPSPPAIALQIIALTSDPDMDIGKLAAAIGRDPALSVKLLRVANSPLYSKRRKSENLRQALVNLGLNAATTLALSFSLVSTYKVGKASGIDPVRYWRRALLSACAARTFGAVQTAGELDNIVLAALLQDLAVLAIDRSQPDFYRPLTGEITHAALIGHEVHALRADHAAVGAWLMRQWKLPEAICATVEASHAPLCLDAATPCGTAARCVALASDCAEVLLSTQIPAELAAFAAHARDWLGIDAQTLADAMTRIVAEIPEIESLFETSLLEAELATSILEQARELLLIRSLQSFAQVSALQETSEQLEARTSVLETQGRRDALTGAYNRGHLDLVLEREFAAAVAGDWPLSIVFADLDRFKLVNDTYGHPAGDSVLKATAQLLLESVRDTDCVARYGGEEFVIVLPGIGADAADGICRRLIARLRSTQHAVAGGTIRATASLGLATYSTSTPFATVAQLLEAADRCVYAAKSAGRDRIVCFNPAERFARD